MSKPCFKFEVSVVKIMTAYLTSGGDEKRTGLKCTYESEIANNILKYISEPDLLTALDAFIAIHYLLKFQ